LHLIAFQNVITYAGHVGAKSKWAPFVHTELYRP